MPCSVQSRAHPWVSMSRASRPDPRRLIGERCPFIAARLPIRKARTCLRARGRERGGRPRRAPGAVELLEAGHEFSVALDVRDHVADAVRVRVGPAGGGDRAAGHQDRPRCAGRRPGVDGERLHAQLRRAAADRRRPGRPVRPAADVHDRRGDLHGRVGGRRARADDRRAGGGPGGAGGGRRDLHAAGPDDALGGDAARAPRRRARGVGRDRRPGGGARSAGGRRAGRQRRLARHLLAERAAGPGADAAGPAAARRDLRPAAPAGPGRCRAGQHRIVRRGLGGDPGRRVAVGQRRGVARAGRWRGAAGVVRVVGDAHAGADAADALLPPPGVRRRRAGLRGDVLRAVRRIVPDHPAAAGGDGRDPVAGGPAHAADGGDAAAARAGQRADHRPDRLPAADDRRPGHGDGRAGLARRRGDAGRALRPAGRAAGTGRRGGRGVLRATDDRDAVGRRAAGAGPGVRRGHGARMMRVMPSLLERQAELEMLGTAVERAGTGRGSAVLVLGEAGIGKTSLVHAFLTAAAGRARVLAGACEDLLTPRALGPLRDAARSAAGGPLAAALSPEVDPDLVFAAVCDELAAAPSPAILVLEDVHWADAATLDVLRYLGTRVQRLPAVLLMTYRDDALARDHPLRGVLGALGSAAASRLRLTPLTSGAVRAMATPTNLDPGELFELTGGNPFYVSEALANPGSVVPPTIVDAVLARVRTLSQEAQTALDRLAVIPSGAEVNLLRVLVGDLAPVAEAERAGVVEVRGDLVAFRHELARLAVAESLPASVRLDLNADVLCALLTGPDGDPFRILHHAVEAGDDDAVITHGEEAAREATRVGAHRQAAACYAQVLARGHRLSTARRAALGEAYSWALSNSNQLHFAVAAAATAAELWQQDG